MIVSESRDIKRLNIFPSQLICKERIAAAYYKGYDHTGSGFDTELGEVYLLSRIFELCYLLSFLDNDSRRHSLCRRRTAVLKNDISRWREAFVWFL